MPNAETSGPRTGRMTERQEPEELRPPGMQSRCARRTAGVIHQARFSLATIDRHDLGDSGSRFNGNGTSINQAELVNSPWVSG